MANPILSALLNNKLGQAGGMVQNIKTMMNAVTNAGDPNAMLNGLAAQNPQVRQVMDMVNQNGGDAKAAFYSMANQMGVDPDKILSMLR